MGSLTSRPRLKEDAWVGHSVLQSCYEKLVNMSKDYTLVLSFENGKYCFSAMSTSGKHETAFMLIESSNLCTAVSRLDDEIKVRNG